MTAEKILEIAYLAPIFLTILLVDLTARIWTFMWKCAARMLLPFCKDSFWLVVINMWVFPIILARQLVYISGHFIARRFKDFDWFYSMHK